VAAGDGVARWWRAAPAIVAGIAMTLGAPAGPAEAAALGPPGTPDPASPAIGNTLSYDEGAAGFCTWWAIAEFHAYTGVYPDFYDPANDGNAGYWAADAAYNGWTVSRTPRTASIAVFPPGVDGADSDGHAAWVTAVTGTQIAVSEMNGPAGWGQVDTRALVPGSTVRYILAP
jgi:surface antigen